MAIATFLSRILGLVREQVMAAYFGASGVTDAFLVAYRIPNLLRDLFAEGAFSSAFVPTFVEANQESQEKSRELLWALFWLLTMMTGLISIGMMIFAPELISVFAPSFTKDPEKFQITVNLTRIMSPFLVFVSLAALFMGALNSLKVFFIPSLAPAFFNLASIACQLGLSGALYSWGFHPAYSLAIGVMVGGSLQMVVQLPLLYKKGFRPMWPKQFWSKRARKIVRMIGPGLVGFAATQINLLISTILATGTVVGATSWLNYSFRLFQLPVGILSVSIGNSNLVHFSEAWKKGDREGAIKFLQSSYTLSLLTVMPALAMLYALSDEMVNVIFERGRFDHASTLFTAEALRLYAIGLPFYSFYKICVPTFYALDRQKIPVIASLFSIGFNISFSLILTPIFGFKILALATTLSMLVNAGIQSVVLKKDLKLPLSFFVNARIIKIIVSTLCAILIAENLFTSEFFAQSFINRALWLGAEIMAMAAIYGILLVIMGERRVVLAVAQKITKKFTKK